MAGPARTPDSILKLRGSKWPKYRVGDKGTKATEHKAGMPTCPTWLTAEAKAEWKRIVPDLTESRVLSKADRATVAAYCQAWADYVEAHKSIVKDGATFVTPKGYIAKNPMVTIRNESRLAMLRYAQELGLTPASRSKVRIKDDNGNQDKTKTKARFFSAG